MSAQPGWVKGYVPTADEWNGWWARKLDNTDPALAGGPYLGLGGGTLTGPLVLAGDPVNNLGAATKQYVDQHVPSGGGNFLPLTGGTLTGPLTLSGAPTLGLHAATMQFVLDKVGTGGVTSFNTRIGAVVMTSGDVTGALSYNPYDSANPAGYQTAAQVAAAGAALVPSNANIVAGLGYTPYNATNPANYQTDAQVSSTLSTYVPIAQKGALNGVASLDATGVVPTTQLPGAVTGTLTYLGGWNASTNTPTLATGGLSGGVAQAAGRYYVVTVGATTAAIDGITTWVAGDWASSNGAAWQRVQNSTSPYLPLTGGSMSANSSITLSGDTWQPSIEPDIVWSLRGTGGNIPVMLDSTGNLNVAALVATSVSGFTSIPGLTSIAATTATFTTATIANETIADVAMPDLIGAVVGSNGNVVSGYDALTGEFNAVSVNAGALKVSGQPLALTAPTAPTDAIDVRAPAYGAKGDGVRNHGYVTTSGSLLTITNFSGTLSLSVVDATTARLDIVGASWSGWAFQPHHEGKLLYLTAGAFTLLARVKAHGYVDGQSVLLDTTGQAITPQTSVTGTLTLPAIDTSQSVAGKTLIVEGMGRFQWWQQTPTVSRQTDIITPYGVQTWYTKTIASFTSPNSITITGSFPFNWSNQPTVIAWGSDDSAAVLTAGLDVWPLKKRVWFSGDGLYLLPGVVGDNAGRPNYSAAIAVNPGPLLNGCVWAGDNAQAYALTTGAQRMPHRVSSVSAPRYNDVSKQVHGRQSFPRCAQIPAGQTINVLFDGDSLSAFNPQGQLAAVMGASRFIAELMAQNPGRSFSFYNVGVGGATWASVSSQVNAYNSSSGNPYKYFTIPKPIVGTVKHIAFWSNINQTGVGPAIIPDLVVMFCCAGNDKLSCDGNSMHAAVNQIRNVAHPDSYGPTDIIMQTDHHAMMVIANGSGVYGGTALPGPASATMQEYYNMGFNRTTAANMGFGFIDYMPLQNRQAFGYDPTRRAMRQVPQVTFTPAPATPVSLAEECLHFAAHINLPAASEAAGWTSVQQIDFQISSHPGNRLFLRMGPNGHIWAAASTYGMFVDTVVTCDPGSHVITLGAAVTTPAVNCTFRGGWPQIDCPDGSIAFDTSMNGKCVIANTGNLEGAGNRPLQRTHIRAVMDVKNAMVHQVPGDAADVTLAGLPVTIGPNQFIPQDTLAQPDVSIIFPDGTIWGTQVAYNGYTSATQATLVDAPPQALAAQTVSLFLGRLGLKWLDTGITPATGSAIGSVTFSVINGEVQLGYISDPTLQVSQTFALKTLERFGGAFNPVVYTKTAQQITLVNRWVDDDTPIAASTPAWYQRGIITTNSDYHQGGTGGHYGSMQRAAVFDTLYSHQNLTV